MARKYYDDDDHQDENGNNYNQYEYGTNKEKNKYGFNLDRKIGDGNPYREQSFDDLIEPFKHPMHGMKRKSSPMKKKNMKKGSGMKVMKKGSVMKVMKKGSGMKAMKKMKKK